jgi:hypothetical protein
VYDMYPWPKHATPGTARMRRTPARATARARGAQAVQVALDRRDNGGAAAAAAIPGDAPAEPTAARTRQ